MVESHFDTGESMLSRIIISILIIIWIPAPCFSQSKDLALSLYGARMSYNDWHEFFTQQSGNFADSYLLALTVSKTLKRWPYHLSTELEGQVVKHFKLQDHWEFNLLETIRWSSSPSHPWPDFSLAFGLGLSAATEKPEIEIENDGETARLLVYWMTELAIVPLISKPNFELILRIHHRSDAFGLMSKDGGSNALGTGFRLRF